MARVAEEPTPSPSRVFARSLRRLAIRDALAALAAAWRLAFEPASPVATSARASAAALFLSVIIIVGVGGAFVTGGALSLLGLDGTMPRGLAPAAEPTESPAVTIEPTPSPSPTPIATPSPSPTPIATPSPSPTPIATPSTTERAQTEPEDRTERETPEPEERNQEENEKRETTEPEERERDERDEKDERDELGEKDEREEDD